ncbi:MAG: methionyl-tRNA formyltransferase [Desulfuromonadales bacterium]
MTDWRIIFMGTPDFARHTLQKLIEQGANLVAVVTQPDRPKGRGQHVMPPPVKELAVEHCIPVLQPLKVRDPDFVEAIRELKPDVIVVVAFGQILPKSLLDIPPHGCINVHASLLPRYRGAAPLNWSIINGETETGVTTMLMDVGLDTGPILLKQRTLLDDNEDIASLHDRMAIMGADLLVETLGRLMANTVTPQQQESADTCYAAMLRKEDGIINWHKDARSIHNQVRGMSVWPGAYTCINNQTLKILRTRIGGGTGRPGTILKVTKSELEVACLSGSLFIEELQLAGKKRLDTGKFLAGFPIAVGTFLENHGEFAS